jgi:hypothetical protein
MNAQAARYAARATLLAGVFICSAHGAGAQRASGTAPATDVVMRAMRDELARSVQLLRLDTLAKPYFIEYRVMEGHSRGASGRLGSLVATNEGRGPRTVQVEVRVGDYAFDNTNYFGAGFMPQAFVGFGGLPFDDDYLEIRRQLWLSTDRAYKQALEALAQKRAALAGRSRGDSIADFSHEPVTNTTDDMPAPAPTDTHMLEALARDLSATFRQSPEIYNSTVGVSESWSRELYVNSEGTSFTRSRTHASVNASASTQALDGTGISMAFGAQALTFSELPGRDSLMKGVRDLAAKLTQQRHVAIADAYDGPVLFEGAAAAELFNAVIAGKLVGTHRPVTSPTFASIAANGAGNDWEDLIGSPVLPRWFSVVDDPTITAIDGHIAQHYRVDEQGVTTHPTTLVDHGVLKTLLTDRSPVTGVPHSTGNHFGFGVRPLNLIVTADSTMSDADIRRKLLALATAQGHPYAVIVRQLSGTGGPAAGEDPQEFFMAQAQGRGANAPVARGMRVAKVFPDGHEEPMRGAEIFGLTAGSFKEIAAASRTRSVEDINFAGSGNILTGGGIGGAVLFQVPSLLFANVTIRKPRGTTPILPVVGPPQ